MGAVLREEDSSLEVELRGVSKISCCGFWLLRAHCWQQLAALVPLEIWVALGIWVYLEGRCQQVLV